MPELPDIALYIRALEQRVVGLELTGVRLKSPFLLRSWSPPLEAAFNRQVVAVQRLGKRIVFELADDFYLVMHLMIAGRLQWKKAGAGIPGRYGLAAFDFSSGTVVLTEAGSKRRASLYLVEGAEALREHDPGGIEVLSCSLAQFRTRLLLGNHTLKRALTDPHLFSGIGNAYSDEILHEAQLSPFRKGGQLNEDETARLFEATRTVLQTWIDLLRKETGDAFPSKVTAFRAGMAVHGRYGKPCPRCSQPVQRIVYANNEANYCPQCQTAGKLLADRALSQLLKKDWPRTLEELERMKSQRRAPK